MFASLLAVLAALSAPVAPQAPAAPLAAFDELGIERSTAPRCAVAFATIAQWREAGDARASDYAGFDAEGGREFFVRIMAGLMDEHGLSREDIARLVTAEAAALAAPGGEERIAAMMPACRLLKDASGL